ncbi:MAG: hypothetical protein JNL38_04860 [Myxococcales bacterium]|nr:hypothetical protein [Myxococcales bacterium]
MHKPSLLFAISALSLVACGPPRDTVYGHLESGRTNQAVSVGQEWSREHPDRAHEIAGALRVAEERDAFESARRTLSFADWQRHVDHVGRGSALRPDEALFLIGKRMRSVEFWSAWTSAYPSSPLKRDVEHELEAARLEALATAPASARAPLYAQLVASHPTSPHRDHLDVLYFEEYVAFLRTTSDRHELERFVRRYPDSPLRPEIEQRIAATASAVIKTTRDGATEILSLRGGHTVRRTQRPGGFDLVETEGDGGPVVRLAPAAWGARYGTDAATQHLPTGVFAEPRADGGCDLGELAAGKRAGVFLSWKAGGCPESLVRREGIDDVVTYGVSGKPLTSPDDILAAMPIRMPTHVFATPLGPSRLAPVELQQSVLDLLVKRSPKLAKSAEGRTALDMLRLVAHGPTADVKTIYAAECKAKNDLACLLTSHEATHAVLTRGDAWIVGYGSMLREGCNAGGAAYCHLSQSLESMRAAPPGAKAVAK